VAPSAPNEGPDATPKFATRSRTDRDLLFTDVKSRVVLMRFYARSWPNFSITIYTRNVGNLFSRSERKIHGIRCVFSDKKGLESQCLLYKVTFFRGTPAEPKADSARGGPANIIFSCLSE